MTYVRWAGLLACSIAALGYMVVGNFNMAGLMLALAVLSWLNIRRKRPAVERPPDERPR